MQRLCRTSTKVSCLRREVRSTVSWRLEVAPPVWNTLRLLEGATNVQRNFYVAFSMSNELSFTIFVLCPIETAEADKSNTDQSMKRYITTGIMIHRTQIWYGDWLQTTFVKQLSEGGLSVCSSLKVKSISMENGKFRIDSLFSFD